MKCRYCGSSADQVFVDLGHQPPSNAYLKLAQLSQPEIAYPLRVYVCNECWLVQLPAHAASDQLFTDSYAYFSSVSSSWVEHAKAYVNDMVKRFHLNKESFVVEVASNDGYLLQFIKQAKIRCLGIEPTASTANAAREKGIETAENFFGCEFADELVQHYGKVDLLVANNVLAHVPDLNDFVEGVSKVLDRDGVATFEFPHLMQLIQGGQFDTIYHEHYSYLSFSTVNRVFTSFGLRVFDVQEIPTHGGSLRVFATSDEGVHHQTTANVGRLLEVEKREGMQTSEYYAGFQPKVELIKNSTLDFLLEKWRHGHRVVGYGAAAKGNTLLNFAGVKPDLLPFICDAAPSKQGLYMPASHIPIVAPENLRSAKMDHILILPWNIASELVSQIKIWTPTAVRFHVAVPEIRCIG